MVLAPANTPSDIVQKLSSEIARVLREPDVQERAPPLGFEVDPGEAVTPDGAKKFLEAELASIGKVIRELGIEPQ
jgi:tripartite-type tricarboxylate transporter receptor subunit TctC